MTKIEIILPILITAVIITALINNAPVYSLFLEGVENGLKIIFSVLPALIAILSLSAMLKCSGFLDFSVKLLAKPAAFFGIPSEILPLALLRPFSGGGSLALLTDMVKSYGADSRISRIASIVCASTETTFYTISVYFRNTEVKYTKRVILAAIFGDLVGILSACLFSMISF